MNMNIFLKNNTEREQATKNILEKILDYLIERIEPKFASKQKP